MLLVSLNASIIQIKHYAPSAKIQQTDKASEVLFKVFEATLDEYGLKLENLAGGTTDSGPDVKAMCVNFLLKQRQISWDWCDCHLTCKAAENAFGTCADPAKSKNKDARDMLRLVIKVAANVNQSPNFKQKFEELQLEVLGQIFKIMKHAPQRWLSLTRTLERIIRLWHVLRRLYTDEGKRFPLDDDNNKDAILQLYSLLQPLSAITRDGQYGAVPMTAEMRMAFAVLKMEVLDSTKPLKVFDIPPAPGSREAEQEHSSSNDKPPLPSKMVPADELHPVTKETRKELSKALVQRLFGRMWDVSAADPSPFRDAAVLLTPPFNSGSYLQALRLTEEDREFLPDSKKFLAPTSDGDVEEKLKDAWADIRTRAIDAARNEQERTVAEVVDGQPSLKHRRLGGASSRAETSNKFASFGRSANVGSGTEETKGGGDEDDALAQAVDRDILRYQLLYISPAEVCILEK